MVCVIHLRPGVDLCHAGDGFVLHGAHGGFARRDGASHGIQLIFALHLAGVFHQFLPERQLEPALLQRPAHSQFGFVECEALVVADMLTNEILEFGGEFLRPFRTAIPGIEVEDVGTVADLFHQRQVSREMVAGVKIPQNHMSVCQHETGAAHVMRHPKLHIRRVGGVADVERIEHQDTGDVALVDVLNNAVEAIFAHACQVRQRQPQGLPFFKGQIGWADFDAVIIVRRAVSENVQLRDPAAIGVDLAIGPNDKGIVRHERNPSRKRAGLPSHSKFTKSFQ